MTGNHVCEKTHNQCEWLGENAKQFNRQHDEDAHQDRHTGEPENMPPKMTVGAEQDCKKRNHTENQSERDVSRYVGRTWQQSKYVVNQNEKEHCQQVG